MEKQKINLEDFLEHGFKFISESKFGIRFYVNGRDSFLYNEKNGEIVYYWRNGIVTRDIPNFKKD